MALNSLYCADVPLSNTHSLSIQFFTIERRSDWSRTVFTSSSPGTNTFSATNTLSDGSLGGVC